MRDANPNPSKPTPVIVPGAGVEPGRASEDAIQRAEFLLHELSNLLDGSLRQIDLARRLIAGSSAESGEAPAAMRHLDAARAAMAHIASIVRSSNLPSARDRALGVGNQGPAAASLASAIRSAADVLSPRARARGIEIRLDLDATTRGVPADEIYAVVSNAVRNSIEAIEHTGRVDVRASVDQGRVLLEILDDGVGPPVDASRVFVLGFSTKPGSSGVGLALAQEVITGLRGNIELISRNLSKPGRPGSALRVTYPVPAARDDSDGSGPC